MPSAPAVQVVGLVKRYGGAVAVDGLDLVAHRGAVTAVLGPNGAGKTTTIECCEGLRQPDGGSVAILDLPPTDPRLRSRVGVMLQDGGLPTAAPARAVLNHVARMYARPRDPGGLAARLGIDAFARTTVRRLSGGQRQRLALACALVGRPELVFLDEPGAGLDPQARQVVWDLVREVREEGVAVVLTTHQMDEAQALADQVVVVDHGRVVAVGTVGELIANEPLGEPVTTARLRTREPVPVAALAAELGGRFQVAAGPEGTCAITGPLGAGDIVQVTQVLATHQVLLTGLTVGARTLEDVFLDLTGRELR